MEIKHKLLEDREVTKRYIDERRGDKKNFKIVNLDNGDSLFFYKKVSSLCWFSLLNCERKITEQKVKLPFVINDKHSYEVFY